MIEVIIKCLKLTHVLRLEKFLSDVIEGRMMHKATWGRKRITLVHDTVKERDYGQLKDLVSNRSKWRQDSK